MRALVYQSPWRKSCEEKAKPVITNTADSVVNILITTIYSVDMQTMKEDLSYSAYGAATGH